MAKKKLTFVEIQVTEARSYVVTLNNSISPTWVFDVIIVEALTLRILLDKIDAYVEYLMPDYHHSFVRNLFVSKIEIQSYRKVV